jgi:hypothetical protein
MKTKTTFRHHPKINLNKETGLLVTIYLLLIAVLFILALNSCKKPNKHIVNESKLPKIPVLLHFISTNINSLHQSPNFSVTKPDNSATPEQIFDCRNL